MGTMRRPLPAHLVARARRLGEGAVTLIHDAHEHGRSVGWVEGCEAMRQRAADLCRNQLQLLEQTRGLLTAAQVVVFAETYESIAPHPVVAAYFSSATDHLSRYMRRLLAAPLRPPAR